MMLLPGDRFQIYYDDWLLKLYPQGFRTPRVSSYHKVWIEVQKVYFDPVGDYAYVCQRCDCIDKGREFVVRLSELTFR